MVIAQFGGGLKEEIKSKVFGVPTPPDNIADVLKAATAAEAESRPTVQNKLTINAVAEVSKEVPDEQPEEREDAQTDPISELTKQIGEVLAITKKRTTRSVSGRPANFRCYGCISLGTTDEIVPTPLLDPQLGIVVEEGDSPVLCQEEPGSNGILDLEEPGRCFNVILRTLWKTPEDTRNNRDMRTMAIITRFLSTT